MPSLPDVRAEAAMRENSPVNNPAPAEPGQPGSGVPRTRMRLFFATALIALVLDLLSKTLVVAHISPTDPGVRLFGGALYLVQARNSGAAFSVGTGATVVLTAISVVVSAIVIRAARRLSSIGWAVALGLVLGGALGNLVDRLFRAPSPGKGHVVDWISVLASDGHIWPIFNLADSSIVVGGILAVVLSLRGVEFHNGSSRTAVPKATRGHRQPDGPGATGTNVP